MAQDFGTVNFNGVEYTLTGMADFTNRQLLDWQTEEGYAEFSAPGHDAEGNAVTAYWIMQCEGVEDLTDLNWDNADRVVSLGE